MNVELLEKHAENIDGRRMLSGKQLDVDYFAIGLGKEKWNIL